MAGAGFDPRGALDLWEVMALVECVPHPVSFARAWFTDGIREQRRCGS